MRFFHDTHIDFIKSRFTFFMISAAIFVLALILIFVLPVEYGIDFTGGTEIQVAVKNVQNTEQIRHAVEKIGFKDSEIKSYGKQNQFLIRVQEASQRSANTSDTTKVSDVLIQGLQKEMGGNTVTKLGENTIGPKVGSEMRTQAFLAVLLSVIAMLIYIAFRFEFVFGLGAIIALVHDVFITFGLVIFSQKLGILNLEVNQSILAAMLTVVGYSINDTVIIFDRIRENMQKHKGIGFSKLVNMSINETLSRTVNTVLTVVLVLITMVIMAGPVLEGFAFTMLLGIIFGTYSSIYIASSFVIWYLEKVKKQAVHEDVEKVKIS